LASTQHEFAHVQDLYLPIGLAMLVLFGGGMIVIAVRYRARDGRAPRPTTDRTWLEIAIACAIAGIVVVLLVRTFGAEANITNLADHGRPAFRVDVLSYRWGWQFTYPSLPGVVDRTAASAPPVLHVPAGKSIRFHLRTRDGVHAFWVPAVKYKADAWPATVRTFDLAFPRGDAIAGHCAQYCGLHHADMTFTVAAMAPAQFRAWATRARGRAR
jgi:cytochrome c oxidase subunit II